MSEHDFQGIELLPATLPVRQLFIVLHGAGRTPADMLPLTDTLGAAFPQAAFLLPEGIAAFDGHDSGRQWFSLNGLNDDNRAARVAAAMPALHALIRQAQDRLKVMQPDTALVGFSQGAIMALEYGIAHDGGVGRVLAFSGRFATLPDRAPEFTTLHVLHGKDDPIIPVEHAYAAYERLMQCQGDATLDVASPVGHELHAALIDRALHRLQTCIPLRTWKNALNGA
ncbi:MAG: esterase [Proteobacteria bacterium]|nr:esterase [Pseudomonadota bacterium]MBS0328840.1 esterase [Pseudomonadota bacterium]